MNTKNTTARDAADNRSTDDVDLETILAPLHKPEVSEAAGRSSARRTTSGEPDGQGLTILLVDDDEDCRLLVRDAIAECKVSNRVVEARDGVEALAFLRREGRHRNAPRPGLIYLDIEMPGMDGQTVLRQIKADPALRDIPVVMMTGVCDETQMQAAAAAGANSYTLKPANAEQFLRTVLASTNYWLTIHQYPHRHLPIDECQR